MQYLSAASDRAMESSQKANEMITAGRDRFLEGVTWDPEKSAFRDDTMNKFAKSLVENGFAKDEEAVFTRIFKEASLATADWYTNGQGQIQLPETAGEVGEKARVLVRRKISRSLLDMGAKRNQGAKDKSDLAIGKLATVETLERDYRDARNNGASPEDLALIQEDIDAAQKTFEKYRDQALAGVQVSAGGKLVIGGAPGRGGGGSSYKAEKVDSGAVVDHVMNRLNISDMGSAFYSGVEGEKHRREAISMGSNIEASSQIVMQATKNAADGAIKPKGTDDILNKQITAAKETNNLFDGIDEDTEKLLEELGWDPEEFKKDGTLKQTFENPWDFGNSSDGHKKP
jgi:hypothetical protein